MTPLATGCQNPGDALLTLNDAAAVDDRSVEVLVGEPGERRCSVRTETDELQHAVVWLSVDQD